jgi:hypothetical protein
VAAADVAKFRLVFDLCDVGVRMYRQRMRRENPSASDEEIEATVQAGWAGRAARLATACASPSRVGLPVQSVDAILSPLRPGSLSLHLHLR